MKMLYRISGRDMVQEIDADLLACFWGGEIKYALVSAVVPMCEYKTRPYYFVRTPLFCPVGASVEAYAAAHRCMWTLRDRSGVPIRLCGNTSPLICQT